MEQNIINNLQNDKIGNIINYFTQGKTTNFIKILKLIYLADEESIKRSGAPITWLEYKAWMRGPVPSDLFYATENIANKKSNCYNGFELTSYFDVILDNQIKGHKKTMSIKPLKPFNDDEFSDFEIKILEEILKEYGNKSVTKLVSIIHAKNGLWAKTVKANNLKKVFKIKANTEYPLSLFELVKGEKFKLYKNAYNTLMYQASI